MIPRIKELALPEPCNDNRLREVEYTVRVHAEKHRVTDQWLQEISTDLKAIRRSFDGITGGWAAVAIIATVAAALGALGAKLWGH